VLATTHGQVILDAIAQAATVDDAPLSAWPERFPGRWITAAQVAEMLGRSSAQLKFTLGELADAGELRIAAPWPGSIRGYQVTDDTRQHRRVEPLPPIDDREHILDALRRWADQHDGRAPSRADWSQTRDPDREWPRATKVAELFEREAGAAGVRYRRPRRCEGCSCTSGTHWRNDTGDTFCDGCFDCLGRCPRGDEGELVGPSGWQYALQLAGLEPRTGGDLHATAAQRLGRNRQVVTGGVADVHPQRFGH